MDVILFDVEWLSFIASLLALRASRILSLSNLKAASSATLCALLAGTGERIRRSLGTINMVPYTPYKKGGVVGISCEFLRTNALVSTD